MVRLAAAAFSSFALTFCVVLNAFYKKKQFYPAVIYLMKNKISLTTLVFQIVVVYCIIAKLLCKLFFGRLQRTEVDNILSKYWFAFVDMCLVFASFQDELTVSFLLYFGKLLIVKGFHWLLEERVDYMERSPIISRKFHIRCLSLVSILSFIDMYYINTAFWKNMSTENVYSAVGVEYFALFFGLIATFVRYMLHTIDSRRSTHWDKKTMYLLLTDIFIGFGRLSLYVDFMILMWKIHPFPLFLVRPIYLSIKFLNQAIRDVIWSRQAIRYMNTVFKDVTKEDLESVNDHTCIICREDMQLSSVNREANTANASNQNSHGIVKKLPCSHMFHASCLKSWFQRQQTCPTCRMDVIAQARQQASNQNRPDNNQRPNQNSGNRQNGDPITSYSQASQNASQQSGSPVFQINGVNVPTYPTQNNAAAPENANFPGFPFPMHPNQMMGIPLILPGNMLSGLTRTMPSPPSDAQNSFIDEGTLRSSVEARFAALRQVQTLMDAAMLQMNAYVSATAQEANSARSEEKKDIKKEAKNEDTEVKESDDPLQTVRQRRLEKFESDKDPMSSVES